MKQREYATGFRKRAQRNKKERLRLYKKLHRRCWYCGKQLKAKAFRLEHQQPFSRGGSCRLNENIVLACRKCDEEKGQMTVEEYRQHLKKATYGDVEFFGENGKLKDGKSASEPPQGILDDQSC